MPVRETNPPPACGSLGLMRYEWILVKYHGPTCYPGASVPIRDEWPRIRAKRLANAPVSPDSHPNRVTTDLFRHRFVTHLRENGADFRTVQELLGHKAVRTTMIDPHVLNRGSAGVLSPLDLMAR